MSEMRIYLSKSQKLSMEIVIMYGLVRLVCVSVIVAFSFVFNLVIFNYKKGEALIKFAAFSLLMVALVTLALEISRIYVSYFYNNLILADLLGLYSSLLFMSGLVLTTSRDVSTNLIKDTLSMFFATLSIIFGLLMQIIRQVGNFSSDLFIATTVFSVLTILGLIYGTAMEKYLFGLVMNSGINSKNIKEYGKNALIVRTVRLGKSTHIVKVLRRDKAHIQKVNTAKFLFGLTITLIILLI